MEAVEEKAKEAIATVGDALTGAKDTAQKWASSAGQGVAQAAESVEGWASDAAGFAAKELKSAGDEITQLIRRYPLAACGIAVGLGYLLSRAFKV